MPTDVIVETVPIEIAVGKETYTVAKEDVDFLTKKGIGAKELMVYLTNYISYLLQEAKKAPRDEAINILKALDDATLIATAEQFKPVKPINPIEPIDPITPIKQ
jgi:hypothetical protein